MRILFAIAVILVSCGSEAPRWRTGAYRLVSARLWLSNRHTDLKCTKGLEVDVSRAENKVVLSPRGASHCEALAEASFQQNLGGGCALSPIEFVPETGRYVAHVPRLSCAEEPPESKLHLEPVNTDALALVARSPDGVLAEYVFERLP